MKIPYKATLILDHEIRIEEGEMEVPDGTPEGIEEQSKGYTAANEAEYLKFLAFIRRAINEGQFNPYRIFSEEESTFYSTAPTHRSGSVDPPKGSYAGWKLD